MLKVSKPLTLLRARNPSRAFAYVSKRPIYIGPYQYKEKLSAYNREVVQKLNEDNANRERLEREAREAKAEAKRLAIFNNKANDKNPANFLKLKIVQRDSASSQEQEQPLEAKAPQPFCLKIEPRKQEEYVQGTRRKVQGGLKKVIPPVSSVVGFQVFEAMDRLASMKTRGSNYAMRTLKMVVEHTKSRNWDLNRVFVAHAMVGRHTRVRGIRYHGKGRTGKETSDRSQIIFKLVQKDLVTLYKEILTGKLSPAIAFNLRRQILNENMDYNQVLKNQYLLTAKGRQQTHLFLKRRVKKIAMDLEKRGKWLSTRLIKEKVLEEEAEKLAQEYESKFNQNEGQSLALRRAVFMKNEGLK